MSNATIHIDGALVLNSLRLQTHDAPGCMDSSYLSFLVQSGIQKHPLWAYGRLAVVTYCYAHVARMSTGDLSSSLQLSLEGEVISGADSTHLLARSIHWHTSSAVRNVAEKLIMQITMQESSPEWVTRLETNSLPGEIKQAAANRRRTER